MPISRKSPARLPWSDYSPEARRATNRALMEMADSMMRASMSLMRKASYVLSPGAHTPGHFIAQLRKYGYSNMPGAEDMVRIEALLRGVPEEQCLSDRRKALQERARQKRLWENRWARECERREALEARVRAALNRLAHESVPPAERARLKKLFDEFMHRRDPEPEPQTDGNVVEGPWPAE